MGNPYRVGIVGLGNISGQYLSTFAGASSVTITAVADLDADRARMVADSLPGAAVLSVDELVSSPDVDVVLNLTIPAAHREIALAAIAAGKDVYGEKPLAVTLEDGRGIIERAATAGTRVGSAPDTVLGTGIQTARSAIERGLIGGPIAASAVMMTPGHELWHPRPAFYYQPGGGPLLDMGPYYVSALVQLLGPVKSVTGASSALRPHRTVATGEFAGQTIDVEVRTHVTGVLEHESGVLSTVTMSFDSAATASSHLEVHGEEGTLIVPDPNMFDGEVLRHAVQGGGWTPVPVEAGYVDASRGVGLIDFMAASAGRPARASGEFALHVLDIMTTLLRSADLGRALQLSTSAVVPALVPLRPAEEWRSSL